MHLWLKIRKWSFFFLQDKSTMGCCFPPFTPNISESCKLDFLKAFIWQAYFFVLRVHIVTEQQAHALQYQDLLHISVTQIKKKTNTPPPKKQKPHQKQPTPHPTPPNPKNPDVYILILVVGNQTVLTQTPGVQTNVCVCVCVSIPVLFCLSPIACLEVAFFPEGFLFDEETDDLWLYVHWNTHTPPTHTKCYCTVNSFSPPPNRCRTVLQQYSDSSLNGTPRCSNPHSSWSLDYYRRISGFKPSLVRVKATLCWPSSRDRNHTI